MLKQIENFCQQYNMLSPGDSVLVCVSGGADSMCLLSVLHALAPKYGLYVYAAHFNHRLRGAESDGDEAFVRSFCEKLGVPLFTGSGDVKSEAQRRGTGIEDAARALRYAFFFETAGRENIRRVATAHSSDDNLETVLMRIARGSGLRGLGGIPPVRGKLIRPLLCLTRAQIESYNAENGIPHREDSSNASDDYTRNRLRHQVVPVLRELNPSVNVTDMTRLLRLDDEYLTDKAREFLKNSPGFLPASALRALPYPVASRAVREFCGDGLSVCHVDAVLELAGSPDPSASLDLPGMTLRREYDKIVIGSPECASFEPFEPALDSTVIIDGTGYSVSCKQCEFIDGIYNSLTTFYIKRDKIVGKLIIRPRVTGDVLKLSRGSRSVKRLMIDNRIPRVRRELIPVVADASGPVAIPLIGQDTDYFPAVGEPAIQIKFEEKNI